MADSSCTEPTSNCVFITDGPDLAVASSTAGVSDTTVSRGSPVTFPLETVVVTNAGNREPTADYEIGFYLSTASTPAELPRNADGTIRQTDGATYTKLLAAVLATGTQDVEPQPLTIPDITPVGTYYLYAYVDSQRVISELDEDNNIVQGGSITVKLALSPTMVSVQSSPTAPVYGQLVTFTLTVTASAPEAGAPAPTGAVQLSDNGLALPGSPVSLNPGGGGIAVLQVDNLGAGPHSLTASYTPDEAGASHYLASPDSSPVVVTITQAAATVSVTGGTFPYDGAAHPATATAKGVGGATVTGSFSFTYSPGGSSAPVTVGQYSVAATFTSSDPNYGPASGTGSIAIGQATTATTLTSSSTPSLLAKAVTLTAKVTAIAPGAGLPTGTVTFKDGATTLGSGTLANVGGTATATLTTSSLSAGSHTITATYGGNTSFLTSTSAPLTQKVSYVFAGFQTPLTTAGTFQSPTASGTWSFSRVIPIKWQLTNGNGTAITDLKSASPLSATFAGATCPGAPIGTPVLLYSPTAGAAGGSTFRSGSSGFNFNWDATKNATKGCWWISLQLSDGSPEKVTAVLLQ